MDNEIQIAISNLAKLGDELASVRNLGYNETSLNFFHALKLASNELVHSAFLVWLLSPDNVLNAEYKVAKKFLELLYDYVPSKYGERINDKIVKSNEEIINISKQELLNQIPTSDKGYYIKSEVIIKNRDNHIDILMHFNDCVIVIENKIGTMVHNNQLCRYIEEVNKSDYKKCSNKIFIYLSPRAIDGELPTNIGGDEEYNDKYCILDYEKVKEMVDFTIKEAQRNRIRKDYIRLLEEYKEMLEVEILMKNSDVRAKCKDIRRMYAKELELLMGCSDNIFKVLDCVKQWVVNNGMHIIPSAKTNGNKVSFDFYSDALNMYYKYGRDKKGNVTKTKAGYYHCGTDGGNVLCIWFLAPQKIVDSNKQITIPASKKLVTLLTWDDRAKEFVNDNCACVDSNVICKKNIEDKLEKCLIDMRNLETDLKKL